MIGRDGTINIDSYGGNLSTVNPNGTDNGNDNETSNETEDENREGQGFTGMLLLASAVIAKATYQKNKRGSITTK